MSPHGRSAALGALRSHRGRGFLKTYMVKIVAFLVLAALIGGAIVLTTWDMPAPTATIEKVIPNERFAK